MLGAACGERRRLPVPAFGGAAHATEKAVGLRAIGFDRLAQVEEGVFDRHRRAVRVVGAGSRQQVGDRLGQTSAGVQRKAAAFQGEVRAGAEDRHALDLAVERLAERFDRIAEPEGGVGVGLIALGRGNQRGERRLVEAAGVAGQPVDRRAGGQHRAGGAVALRIEHRHRAAADQVTCALGRPAIPAPARQIAIDARAGQCALVLIETVAVVGVEAEKDVVTVAVQIADPADEFGTLRVHAALIGGTAAEAQFGALKILPGDDIDHASHRVGAVHRRGAILEHFDALHCHQRQRVEIDEGVAQAIGGKAVIGQAATVEQDQRVLLRQSAQADARRAGRPAVVGGFIGGVAGVGRDGTQRVGHGDLAGLLQLLAVDHLHRVWAFAVAALDVGTGDADGSQGLAGGGCCLVGMCKRDQHRQHGKRQQIRHRALHARHP